MIVTMINNAVRKGNMLCVTEKKSHKISHFRYIPFQMKLFTKIIEKCSNYVLPSPGWPWGGYCPGGYWAGCGWGGYWAGCGWGGYWAGCGWGWYTPGTCILGGTRQKEMYLFLGKHFKPYVML